MIRGLSHRLNTEAIDRLLGLAPCEGHNSRRILYARVAFRIVFALCMTLCMSYLYGAWNVDDQGIAGLSGKAPAWDFTNLWMGSRLALSGDIAVLFDVDAYRAAINRDVYKFILNSEWSYPPPMLLVGVPFTYLSLSAAHVVWTIVTPALLAVALRIGGASFALCALMIVSPAAMMNMVFGQNGALTASLLIGGLIISDRRALLGGAIIGLLIIKPHAALLAPVCFLAARNYAAFVSAGLSVCFVALASFLAFGPEVWIGFFQVTAPLMVSILEEQPLSMYQISGISVFLLARTLGADVPMAYGVQALVAMVMIAATWSMWRRSTSEPLLRVAATGVATILVTPYGYTYELFYLTLAGLLLAMRTEWRSVSAILILILSWLWPAIAGMVTNFFLPLTPFVAAFILWACWRALRASPHEDQANRAKA